AAMLMIAGHAASRACAISYLVSLEYVRAEGKAKPVAQRMSMPAWLCACVFGLPWLFWPVWSGAPDWRAGVATLGVLAVLRYALGRYFVRRIGGYTGDCLGLAQQVFEIAIYLVGLAWISF
ncbi:adenosylcobinamide-GDP ribazoletransferase, partial [Paraburkholderia sp. BR14261]